MISQANDVFRLSPKQEHLWSLGQRQGNTPYVAQCVVMIEGPLDPHGLKESLFKIVEQHEILRTNFRHRPEMNIPVQTISKVQIAWADPCDLQEVPAEHQQLELQRRIEASRNAPFDIDQGPVLHALLVQVSSWEHHLILSLPALCADLQSLNSLVQQISAHYGSDLSVEETDKPGLQYADVSQWFHEMLAADDAWMGREYWRNQHVASAGSIPLPLEKRAANKADFQPQVVTMEIAGELNHKMAELEQRGDFSLHAFFLSCWQVLLWRFTRQSPLQIGLACNGRDYPELEKTLGLLTAHVPILSEITAGSTSRDIFEHAAAKMSEAQQWQDCFTWSGAGAFSNDSSLSFFPICFEFSEYPAAFLSGGVKFTIHRQYACIDRFKVKLSCVRTAHSLTTEFHYDPELFDSENIQCLASRFQTLLASVLAEPDGTAGTWEILSDGDRQILAEYNATAEKFADNECVQQLFEHQVERSPHMRALSCGDEQFSYAELNAAANKVAHHLLRCGIGPESRVAICLERSPLMVIALLGTLKTGAAYVPLDVQAPPRRLQFILEDARASAVLTQERFRALLPEEPGFLVRYLDTEMFPAKGENSDNPPPVGDPENLVYVIYTSGSTGNPKGVMVHHRGLVNYLNAARQYYRFNAESRALVQSSFSFDLTVTCILLPLLVGGTVELARHGDELERLCDALASPEQHYSLIKLTPSHLQILGSWLGERERCGCIDALVLGGEALPGDLLTVWQQQSPKTRLINEYGPTETVVGCSIYEVSMGECNGTVPIGRPISNMQMYVLDEEMRLLPTGTIGEIYIGGEGVARGYLGRPSLTAQRFVPDPFSAEPGKRLYRSGDLGQMRADGEMEYLGRTDAQVKIRGFRVELGEVESVLRRHSLVKESAVILQGTGEEKRLLGYLVLAEDNGEDRELRRGIKEEIKAYLRRELPEYMVPKDIIVLQRMPLTPNGKVDRKALPLPSREFREDTESYSELSPVGKTLARLWCEFLNLERVGVNENFFAIGGDSILAVQIAFKAKQMGIIFHPVQLFRHPTIAQLESVIGSPSAESLENDHRQKPTLVSGQSAQTVPLDFPLANLSQEKLNQILRKASSK